MIDVVNEENLTVPTSSQAVDIDQAIRFGKYLDDESKAEALTEWKELNKIYKLQIPTNKLNGTDGEDWQREYEEIICTSVAMKLVAA